MQQAKAVAKSVGKRHGIEGGFVKATFAWPASFLRATAKPRNRGGGGYIVGNRWRDTCAGRAAG